MGTNIFVKNLDESATADTIREMFAAFGEITSLALMKNEDGTSKGFAFINFADMDSAKKAVDAKNGEEFMGKLMYVGRAQKKSERMAELKEKFDKIKMERINKYQGVNLYVKNLDEQLADEAFRKAFEEYGQITSCKIMRDDKGNAKGFGFVCYTTNEEASKAVTEMNGKILASKPIYVALAQRKEQRRAQLQPQMGANMPGRRGFPGQGGRGQQFQGNQPGQGYMVQGPQGARQARQNQRGARGAPQQGGKGQQGRGRGQAGAP